MITKSGLNRSSRNFYMQSCSAILSIMGIYIKWTINRHFVSITEATHVPYWLQQVKQRAITHLKLTEHDKSRTRSYYPKTNLHTKCQVNVSNDGREKYGKLIFRKAITHVKLGQLHDLSQTWSVLPQNNLNTCTKFQVKCFKWLQRKLILNKGQ